MAEAAMEIGHNLPPGPIESAAIAQADISAFLQEHPVVLETDVTEFKTYLDRGKITLQELDAARKLEVEPFNSRVKTINGQYKIASSALERLVDALKERLADYIRVEADKRQAAAEAALQAAKVALGMAKVAEAKEREAIAEAKEGVLVDVGLTIREADAAFSDYQRAEREAQRAGRETHVKISGGFKNAVSLRTKETLVVVDGLKAIMDMGLTEDIMEAILKSARAYRRKWNRLPSGIRVVEEETL